MSDLRAILASDPSDVASLENQGSCQEQLGLYYQAIQSFKQAVKFSPSFDIWLKLGQAYWSNGDQSPAWAALKSATPYAQLPSQLFQLASTQSTYNDVHDAQITLGMVLSPERDWQWYALTARLDTTAGDGAGADAAFTTSVNTAPPESVGSVYLAWGDSLFQRGIYDKAATEYGLALQSDPTSSEKVQGEIDLSQADEALRRNTDARQALLAALSANSDAAEAATIQLRLAQLDVQLGNTSELRSLVNEIEHDPHASAELKSQANALLTAGG